MPKFNGKQISLRETLKTYIEILPFNEMYEITLPAMAINNIIFGNLYMDL